jgi:AcrR family transcriptional regulator
MARPRSVRAHDQVLEAALRLFADRGIDATSMDAIAETSGVSKATIYKHWQDKDALCLEVMSRLHGRDQPVVEFDSGDLRADLIAVLSYQPPERYAELRARMMPHLIAYSARHQAFGLAWRQKVLEPPRLQLRRILDRAIAEQRLSAALDYDIVMAMLLGPMMYRHIFKLLAHQPEVLAAAVVEAFVKAHAIAPQPAAATSPAQGAPRRQAITRPRRTAGARRRGLPRDAD